MALPLSVLDLSPISAGSTGIDALRRTLDLAQLADRLGYARYWLAEHHNLASVASTAPEVMISHVASLTRRSKGCRLGLRTISAPRVLLLVASLTLGSARASDPREVESFTTPGGADCVVATPGHSSGKLLLLAHGLIPAARPLGASLRLDHPVYRRLIDAGWTIAATSFRRNGMILADGAADVEALRREVARRHGPFATVLVEGTSMGGYIAAMLAENPPDPSYRGALALGAALEIKAPEDAALPLTGKPKFPILFLSTQDEIAGPADYARRAGDKAAAAWKVTRDGHVNLNQAETGAAYDALLAWMDGAPIAAGRDATLPPPARPRTAVFSAGGHTVTAHVIDVDPVYGNLTIDLRPEDAGQLGWRKGDWASLRVGDAREAFPILHGRSFGDVKEGAWVSFPTAEGQMLICRNFADAAGTSGAKIGTPVEITRPPTD